MMRNLQTIRGFSRAALLFACLCVAAVGLLAGGAALPGSAALPGFATGATAEGAVLPGFALGAQKAYADQATKVVLAAPGKEAAVDLFANFKSVMPGDTLSQDIVVENGDPQGRAGKVFLGVDSVDDADGLLAQLELSVICGDKVLFSGPPSGHGNEADPVYLGVLKQGESLECRAELTVPLEMGNDFAFSSGSLDWVFQMEEYIPDNGRDDDRDNPSTGDPLARVLPVGITAIIVAGALAAFAFRKSRKQD